MRALNSGNIAKDLFLTNEIRYLEFDGITAYQTVVRDLKKSNCYIIYSGIHRLEAGKWIIVIYDTEEVIENVNLDELKRIGNK